VLRKRRWARCCRSWLPLRDQTDVSGPSLQGKNVLRKEPMGKEVEDGDAFSVNDGFTSKFYKVG